MCTWAARSLPHIQRIWCGCSKDETHDVTTSRLGDQQCFWLAGLLVSSVGMFRLLLELKVYGFPLWGSGYSLHVDLQQAGTISCVE